MSTQDLAPPREADAASVPVETTGTVEAIPSEAHVLDELLVEEISIDGMCGVY